MVGDRDPNFVSDLFTLDEDVTETVLDGVGDHVVECLREPSRPAAHLHVAGTPARPQLHAVAGSKLGPGARTTQHKRFHVDELILASLAGVPSAFHERIEVIEREPRTIELQEQAVSPSTALSRQAKLDCRQSPPQFMQRPGKRAQPAFPPAHSTRSVKR
jgi:hypothetical protein